MRLKLTVAYDGTAYEGWQAQDSPRQPFTIQGELEKALARLTSTKCRVTGAGRTDSGVHALGQVAHVDVPRQMTDWRKCLNAVLPPDIRIVLAENAASDFHARRDAITKTYIYKFWREPAFLPPAMRHFVWDCGPMDLELILPVLPLFRGEHDFASFRNSGSDVQTTVRTIQTICMREEPLRDWLPAHISPLCLEISGTGFLKQMVRNIAGFLAAIGKHKLSAKDFYNILEAKDRRKLPSATAPAKGLFLAKVAY